MTTNDLNAHAVVYNRQHARGVLSYAAYMAELYSLAHMWPHYLAEADYLRLEDEVDRSFDGYWSLWYDQKVGQFQALGTGYAVPSKVE